MQVQVNLRASVLAAGVLLLTALVAPSCVTRHEETRAEGWAPWNQPVQSPSQLSAALESRWCLDRLKAFVRLNPPVKASKT